MASSNTNNKTGMRSQSNLGAPVTSPQGKLGSPYRRRNTGARRSRGVPRKVKRVIRVTKTPRKRELSTEDFVEVSNTNGKPGEVKSGWSKFWDVLKNIGSVALKVLPLLLGKGTKSSNHTISLASSAGTSIHTMPISTGTIAAAYTGSIHPSVPPVLKSTGEGMVLLGHSGYVGVLNSVRNGTPVVRGDKMFSIDITPAITRYCARLAAFQKFRFRNIAFTMIPSVSTENAARVMGYFERDVDNIIVTGEGNATIEAASSLTSACIAGVWVPHTFVTSFHGDEWYFTSQNGIEPRTNKQGVFTIVASSDFTNDIPSPVADIICTFEVEFREPSLTLDTSLGMMSLIKSTSGDGNANLPFGTAIATMSVYDSVDAGDPGDLASCVIDSRIPIKYSTTYVDANGDTVTASTFRLPRGYYFASLQMVGNDLTDLPDHPWSVHGGYRIIRPGTLTGSDEYGWNWSFQSPTSPASWVSQVWFASTGLERESSISLKLDNLSVADSPVYAVFTCIGGDLPYVNPYQANFSSLSSAIKQLRMEIKKDDLKPNEKGKEKDKTPVMFKR